MDEIFESNHYRRLVLKNNYNALDFLLREGIEFTIGVHVNVVEFNPPIPKEIIEFKEFTIFAIANYTFESCKLSEYFLEFEAGFGAENFPSFVKVPLEAIGWIAINSEEIIAISHYKPKERKEDKQEQIQNSMQALLQNPENLKLMKKKKK